jgi:hypothetical protein
LLLSGVGDGVGRGGVGVATGVEDMEGELNGVELADVAVGSACFEQDARSNNPMKPIKVSMLDSFIVFFFRNSGDTEH